MNREGPSDHGLRLSPQIQPATRIRYGHHSGCESRPRRNSFWDANCHWTPTDQTAMDPSEPESTWWDSYWEALNRDSPTAWKGQQALARWSVPGRPSKQAHSDSPPGCNRAWRDSPSNWALPHPVPDTYGLVWLAHIPAGFDLVLAKRIPAGCSLPRAARHNCLVVHNRSPLQVATGPTGAANWHCLSMRSCCQAPQRLGDREDRAAARIRRSDSRLRRLIVVLGDRLSVLVRQSLAPTGQAGFPLRHAHNPHWPPPVRRHLQAAAPLQPTSAQDQKPAHWLTWWHTENRSTGE